jgi:hypothetical protein
VKGNVHARFCSRGGGSDPLVYCNRVGGKREPAQTATGYRCVLPKAAVNAVVARRQYRLLTEEERQARVARLHGQPASSAGYTDEEMANA